MDWRKLRQDLERDEGCKSRMYRDSVGKHTIGIGFNLTDGAIPPEAIEALYNHSVLGILDDLDRKIPWWRNLPEPCARGLANMAFNLGWPRLSKFKKMLAALEEGDLNRAASEALNSKWAEQVGDRAVRISKLIRG